MTNKYVITKAGLEEFYDALALVNGKTYADKVWDLVERDTANYYQEKVITKMGDISKICKLCNNEIDCKEHDIQIKMEATDKVLLGLLDYLSNVPICKWGESERDSVYRVIEYFRSRDIK